MTTSYSYGNKNKPWDLIKLKRFCIVKEAYKQSEKTVLRKGENNCKLNNWQSISKIQKQLLQLNTRKTNHPIKNWADGLNRHFSNEGKEKTNKHIKICSTSLIIREIQVKTAVRYYLTPQNGCHQKIYQQWMLERVWSKGNLLALFMEI